MLKTGKKNRIARIEFPKPGNLYRSDAFGRDPSDDPETYSTFSDDLLSPKEVVAAVEPEVVDTQGQGSSQGNEGESTQAKIEPDGAQSDPAGVENPPASPNRSKLVLDFSSAAVSKGRHSSSVSAADGSTIEEDWVLLDCCFGIPLFNATVNQQVCNRIALQKLCHKDR